MMWGVNKLAPPLRRALEPMWARYTGAATLDAWRALEVAQWADAATARATQLARLQALLRAAYTDNAFYRQRFDAAGVRSDDIRSLEDLRRLPLLTKAEVRTHASGMLSQGFTPSALMRAKTGGSTGKPIEVFFTEEVSQLRNAAGRRNKRWAGWEIGESVGAVWGNPVFPVTIRDRLRDWLLTPTIVLDTMSVSEDTVRGFVRQWARVRPTMLFGHAHSLFVLATIVDQLRIDDIRPKAIIPTSMMLPPHERRVIERVFGTKATDIYGCEEVGLIAGECERHEGLHTNDDQLVVEVLHEDGAPVGPGETGHVVVTDLLNRAMPLIRYCVEDMAEISQRPCSCGRPTPTLARIVGRTADFLRRADGSRVAGISLIENTLTRIPGMAQMQIVQERIDSISVRVVPAEAFTPVTRAALLAYFADTFPGARVTVDEVATIAAEPNGKYRFSICRIPE